MEQAHSDEHRELGRKRLGRGLHALLGDDGPDELQPAPPPATPLTGDGPQLMMIPVEKIERNPFQPRTQFESSAIEDLAHSIRRHGVLQPLLVRTTENGFQLIAGERRWLAAQKAEVAELPCRVMPYDDQQVCEAALEENLKRADLNDLEKARAFQRFLTTFGVTIEELGKRLSLNRSTVSNILRLLDLPPQTQEALLNGQITAGHARALLPLSAEEQQKLCGEIIVNGWSVRQTEQAVRELQAASSEQVDSPEPASVEETQDALGTIDMADYKTSNHILSLQDQLRDLTGAKVTIRQTGKETGQIILHFNSNDEFERIMRALRRPAA